MRFRDSEYFHTYNLRTLNIYKKQLVFCHNIESNGVEFSYRNMFNLFPLSTLFHPLPDMKYYDWTGWKLSGGGDGQVCIRIFFFGHCKYIVKP